MIYLNGINRINMLKNTMLSSSAMQNSLFTGSVPFNRLKGTTRPVERYTVRIPT